MVAVKSHVVKNFTTSRGQAQRVACACGWAYSTAAELSRDAAANLLLDEWSDHAREKKI